MRDSMIERCTIANPHSDRNTSPNEASLVDVVGLVNSRAQVRHH